MTLGMEAKIVTLSMRGQITGLCLCLNMTAQPVWSGYHATLLNVILKPSKEKQMEPHEFANAIAAGTQRNYEQGQRRAKIKRLAVITSAYTGYLCAPVFSEMHEYIEKLLNRPVFTHEMASQELMDQIREAAKPDFLAAWGEALKD